MKFLNIQNFVFFKMKIFKYKASHIIVIKNFAVEKKSDKKTSCFRGDVVESHYIK
jgi:hypothetical protein